MPFHDKIRMYREDGISRDDHGKDGTGMTGPQVRTGAERNGTILLVEDSDVVREVIARMLENGGFDVHKASGGEKALSLLRSGDVPFDLLLIDVVMPEMSGVELADRVASEHPETRILFMTGHSDDMVSGKGMLGGNREYIGKPFSQGEILEKVRVILSR